MPTGYTCDVADGKVTTLKDFALQCARGMGALISMRDEPSSTPIPERLEPHTTYHDEHLSEARTRLAEVTAMTPAECEAEEAKARAKAAERRDEYLRDKQIRRERYEAMIAKVEAWSTEAEGIREFMLEQLRRSVDFDCGGNYEPEIPEPRSGSEWQFAEIKKITKDIGYHEQERAAEIARTETRNRWLQALRRSLVEFAEDRS